MSASPVTKTRPIAGAKFRRAASLKVEGRNSRKVLCLLAACEDGGHTPSVQEIAKRVGLVAPGASVRDRHRAARHVDAILRKVEAQGLLRVERQRSERNRYQLLLDGGQR